MVFIAPCRNGSLLEFTIRSKVNSRPLLLFLTSGVPHFGYVTCSTKGSNLYQAVRPTTRPTKAAGTLRRAVRNSAFARIPGERQMERAYYFDFDRRRPTTVRYL